MHRVAAKRTEPHSEPSRHRRRPVAGGFGPAATDYTVLPLQRAIGNHAVRRVLDGDTETREVPQSRATLNHRDEQEANAMADNVMGGHTKQVQLKAAGAAAGVGASEVPPPVRDTLSSRGQPLARGAREFFESRFAQDFSDVRVHTGPRAAASAHALGARAFAYDDQIVFGARQYAPGSAVGMRLLAHELAHVAQQRHTAQPVVQCSRWFRGQAIGVSTATDVEHDIGSGSYWSDRVEVAADYGYGRGSKAEAERMELWQLDIPGLHIGQRAQVILEVPGLGRVLNLDAETNWHTLIGDAPLLSTYPLAGQIYAPFFAEFLGLPSGSMTADIDRELDRLGIRAVVAPEYAHGGLQLVIRHPESRSDVLDSMHRMRPVLSDVHGVGSVVATVTNITAPPQLRRWPHVQADGPFDVTVRIRPPDHQVTFRLDVRGTVVEILPVPGTPQAAVPLLMAYARQIAGNLSPAFFTTVPSHSGGSGPGPGPAFPLVRSPAQPIVRWEPPGTALASSSPGAELVRSPARPLASKEAPMSRQGPHPFWQWPPPGGLSAPASPGRTAGGSSAIRLGAGAAVLASLLSSKIVARGNERQRKMAEDAISRLWPDVESGLQRDGDKGVVIVVVYKKHYQSPVDLFRWADFRLVTGQTLAEAKADYLGQEADSPRAYDRALKGGNYLEFNYAWYPPFESEEPMQFWTNRERPRGRLDAMSNYLGGFLERLTPTMLRGD